jgi:hypothetical protein
VELRLMPWRSAADLLESIDERRQERFEGQRMRPILGIRATPQPPEDGVGFDKVNPPEVRPPEVRFHHAEAKVSKRRDPVSGKYRYRLRCTCGWNPVSHGSEAWARRAFRRHMELA